jgi:hypothetical protein
MAAFWECGKSRSGPATVTGDESSSIHCRESSFDFFGHARERRRVAGILMRMRCCEKWL